jgi:Flp pilus assembly CpaF family ATPase
VSSLKEVLPNGGKRCCNVLAGSIPNADRIMILEDVAELSIRKQHVGLQKYDDLTQSQLRMNEFGGTLGGPVARA